MLKHLVALLVVLMAAINAEAQQFPANVPVSPTQSALVYVVPIKGEIMDRGLAYFVRHAVEQAKEEKAALIIFEIDTPGGAVGGGEEYTIGICNSIDRAVPITTVAYVTHWAWSAGSLISISADKIVMKQVASIGSAEVIAGSGDEKESIHQEKYTSAIRTEFKARAEKKGYSANLAMAMVDKDLEVHEVMVDGARQFLTPQEIQETRNKGKLVEEIKLVIAKGKLLNLSAKDALKYGLATAIKEERSEIPPLVGISNFTFKEVTPTWSEHLVMYITSPIVSGILLLAGFLAAYMAYQTPGTGLMEAIAVVCFALVFFGYHLIGLAEVTEVLLFILGMGLVAVEIFLLPGFGVFVISGVILIIVSLIMSMQGFVIPDIKGAPWQLVTLKRNFIVVGFAFSLSVIIFIIIARYLSSVPFFNHLILSADVKTSAGFSSVAMDAAPLLGKKGVVFTALRPVGKIAMLDGKGNQTGENIEVVTEGDFINKGETVVVINIDGSRIVVEKTKA
ncbi:MAG: nodulation protein NfeD [Planctomycetes bacterium]|nr:nodulation protein NfeD [Planctomycetota bacterium]